MMPYMYLLCAICGSAMLSVFGTFYTNKNAARPNVSRLYNLLVTCSAFAGWLIIFLTDPAFDARVIPYSIGYGGFYTVAMLGLIGALGCGSVSLTAFFKQLSLVCVSFWGFLFWDDPITLTVALGILLIAAALVLCLFGNKGEEKGGAGISLKWLLFATMLLVGNAGCSIIQKYQQMAFDGKHGSMMMVFATAFSILVSLVLCMKEQKTHYREAIKKTWFFPVLAGCGSAVLNLFIILLASTALSPSIIYPGIAVGGFLLTTLVSVLVFRERLRARQWVGLAVGALALVFLNL